jgi:single-strand DNA-binding protein
MKSLNKVQIIGNLGSAPDIRDTKNGKLASFRVATNGTTAEQTDWHNVVVFNDNLVAIIEEHLEKGNRVYLEGRLRTRQYDDDEGVTKYITEVVAHQLIMLDGKPVTA